MQRKVRWPLSFICSYAMLVTQRYKRGFLHGASENAGEEHDKANRTPYHTIKIDISFVSEKNWNTKKDKGM